MSVLVRPAQISGLADPDRGFHPVPAQNSRRMLLTKVSFDLNRILGTHKELQDNAQERAEERRRSGAPEPDSGAPEPVVDPSASPRAEEGETLVDRLAREEVARQQERAYVENKKGAMEKYRISDECPDAECQRRHGRTRIEIDPDGNAGCPRCGYFKENVEEEMPSGETQIVNRQDQNTYEDGNDNRKHTDLLEQEDKNKALYVINLKDAPGATPDQIWWANNRMNQSMFWADMMGEDSELEDGFGISGIEVGIVKQLLRQVCIVAAMDLATDYYDDEDEKRENSEDFLLGSPLLWTALLTLHVMTLRQEGFRVATEIERSIATLEDLHLYMGRFAGTEMKMYRESMASFLTTVKGLDAKQAAARLDRVRKRRAAYYPLGADPVKLAAKIAKLNELLVQTRGNKDGLADVVINRERPELLSLEARRRHVVARDSAVNKGKVNTMLVKGEKQRAKHRDLFGVSTTKVKPDRSKPGDNKGKGNGKGKGSGGGGGGGGGKGGKGKGKGGKGKGGLSLANLQGEGDGPGGDSDSDDDSDTETMTPEELMLKNVMRESRLEDAKAKAAAKAKVEAEAAAKAKAEAEARDGVDEIANLFGTSGGGGGGSSSSSGLEVDEELLAMTIGDLEMEIARRQSFIEEEEKNGNGEAEEVETARQEAIRFAIALDVKKARDAGGDWEMGDEDEALFGEAASAFENGEGMDVDTSAGEDPEPEPALTDEGGEFVSEDAEIQMAVDLLSLDLSPEAFERQQEEMMQAMIAQHERTLEINAAERAARVQEEARKQEEREAQYRQEGEYDRDKDIRNDVDAFIAAGMPIPTPSVLDGFAGRPGGENYTSKKKIQQLTFGQVQSSANFRRNPSKFIRQWQELQRQWRMEVAAKVAKHVDADRKKAESRKKREDAAKVRAAETAKEEKRLQEVRATVAANKARRIEKQMRSAQNQARKGLGPVIDKSTLSKDKMKWTFKRDGKLVVDVTKMDDSKKRKQRMAKCHKCGATREVERVRPGFTCEDINLECHQKRKCHLCGRDARGDGPPPPGWKCEDSGEYGCLSPSERQGKYAKK